MTLDDFEKELAASQKEREREKTREKYRERDRDSDKRRHRDKYRVEERVGDRDRKYRHSSSHHSRDRHHHHSSRHSNSNLDEEDRRRHKRSRHSSSNGDEDRERSHKRRSRREEESRGGGKDEIPDPTESNTTPPPTLKEEPTGLTRDSWMEAPSALDIDYVQRPKPEQQEHPASRMLQADFGLKLHKRELNRHLHDIHEEELEPEPQPDTKGLEEPVKHEVDYTFGDAGSQWRMTKLKAREKGTFRAEEEEPNDGQLHPGRQSIESNPVVEQQQTKQSNTTDLNRLKAQMMKAKLRRASNATELEAEYNAAVASMARRKDSDVVVLGVMENRLLAGGERSEVKPVETKRGKERGLVQENEDMSIEDMVREERRTRGQAGGEGQRFAERIAKDAKFDNDLEYMDENAAKLAKRVQKSEINLKNTAISQFQKVNRILDSCPLCYQENTETPPLAPVVSLATRVYLTLPTEPELSEGSACIVPIQHHNNLLECDDDEWEEIRNFMKSLTRMYHDQGRDVIFYENAAQPQRHRHAAMEAVPLPYSLGEMSPAFFKEAILAADEEWTQHKKLIDTLAQARSGLGKLAFRRTIAKEMPYFHVWFELDGGLGHIVEDASRWPRGDLFAREVIGGMLDLEPDVIKRQGRWRKGGDGRVDGFKKRWRKFDWTRVLTEG
ncbi:hypothetical protein PAAG_02751 [Paracoccidioides lutzii Pb01]|uniref:Cell cycle control protein cwf19 n=1 Tax=Paracoccidioides lutzii (strain ATCC MYA-826 / Pb01) TaxID=502779 RepID=C1GW56_PARBA|nr:hypothetical protein PAAG_02751 [Paracoccidioides lutzii Pb01]EEH40775.2 hypothetical protein PAAG_02751 [Paracoccidioides lutzii Pb01]